MTICPAPRTIAALIARGKIKAKTKTNGSIPPEHEENDQHPNTLALQRENLPKWVEPLFEGKAMLLDSGVWRITSAALGRPLQEDISISPEGIVDFGVADQGDPQEGRHAPPPN